MAVADSVAVRGFLPARARAGLGGELWAEFFGTFILICFGDGVVAMLWALVGSGRSIPPVATAGAGIFSAHTSLLGSGDWLLITWGWALAVCFAIYAVGGVTGAHINPAITLGAALRKALPWNKVVPYWVAQVLGAFLGAALVFLVYNNALNHFDQTTHAVKGQISSLATYATFATFPAPYFHNPFGPLVDQIVGTFFLALFVFAVTDELALAPGSNLGPWIVGMIVMAVGISFGANAGYAINPARDFGPRIFAWIAGWGKLAMPGDYGWVNTYFWVPIIGPLLGAALAVPFYDWGLRSILIARAAAAQPEPPPGGEVAPAPERPGSAPQRRGDLPL